MARSHKFVQVDAFTTKQLHGNPCAVVFDADDIEVLVMQAIALEMNLSETVFILQSQIADFRVRFFTPMEEIPLAGHPTISAVFSLIYTGRLALTADYMLISLELQVGPIPIEIYSTAAVLDYIVMTQKKPEFIATVFHTEVAEAFGLDVEDLNTDYPCEVVSTGTPQLMVLVRSLESLKKARVQIEAYTALRARVGFFSPHLFINAGFTDAGRTFARHFGVPPDTMEDPFTGSATGGMAAYLWRHGLLHSPRFIAEQGHLMGRPGEASVEVIGDRDDIQKVKVGGTAVAVVTGELLV
jgi:trans-2,3-dihydro-3-hydroxyanthranilate isomerase